MSPGVAINRTPGKGVGVTPPSFGPPAPWFHGVPWPSLGTMDTKPPARAPIVERVAGWSARHRKTAVFGWLLLVVVAVAVGHQLGTSNVNSYDPGQAGKAERVLDRPVVQQPAAESVLVQSRPAGQTHASDPEMRQAVREVVAALRALPGSAAGIQSPLTSPSLVSTGQDGGRSALVTFNVAGKPGNDDKAVVPALNAVAAVQAHHPGLKVEEAGGASVDRAIGSITGNDFRKAEVTSIPVSLVLLLVVLIAWAGLFLTGMDVFSGVVIGTILVVGVAVLGSLTFLPAILSMLGPWTDRGRIPFLGRRRTAARASKFWGALARAVVRRPLAWGGVAAIVLLALAAPALRLNLEDPGIHSLPSHVPVVPSLAEIAQAFPGGPAPAEVVVTGADLGGRQVSTAVAALHGQVAATHGAIREPITTAMFGHDQVLVVSVPLAGSGTNAASNSALATLRDHALPATLGKAPGISYAVAGLTAGNHDFDAQLAKTVPWVFVFVLGLAFLLLMVSFRSVYIPALSICLNLLSVGSAYGLMVLIFQDGHFQGPLGFTAYGGITAWLPLFMFVLLFGLSMDYTVFILSRIRELRERGESARDAITHGIASSAGVVTSAAAIMVAVFSIFATLSSIEFKLFGITMAAGVLLDATVVRWVLLPAALSLLGDRVFKSRGVHRTYGETASATVSEPPRPTNGWSRTRETADSISSARS